MSRNDRLATFLVMGLDNYEVMDLLHESGRSVVRRARRRTDARDVVIKTPAEHLPPANYLARFRNEWVICTAIDSPHVVRSIELIDEPGLTALVFESSPEFTTLSARVDARPPSVRESLQVALGILDGLAAIHARNIVHKDIKPANVLVDPTLSRALIIDFSIASFVSRDVSSLAANTRLEGTVGYMAPEQTGRINRPVDYRSDYYGLGATLYWMLAGERPFAEFGYKLAAECRRQPRGDHEYQHRCANREPAEFQRPFE